MIRTGRESASEGTASSRMAGSKPDHSVKIFLGVDGMADTAGSNPAALTGVKVRVLPPRPFEVVAGTRGAGSAFEAWSVGSSPTPVANCGVAQQ